MHGHGGDSPLWRVPIALRTRPATDATQMLGDLQFDEISDFFLILMKEPFYANICCSSERLLKMLCGRGMSHPKAEHVSIIKEEFHACSLLQREIPWLGLLHGLLRLQTLQSRTKPLPRWSVVKRSRSFLQVSKCLIEFQTRQFRRRSSVLSDPTVF